MQPMKAPRHDIVVFGATSFVGQILTRYLCDEFGTQGKLRWAIAGRNATTLAELRSDLRTTPDVLIADADDAAAIDALVSKARVVLTTAGPFARYGEALVRSCATRGVDYVDITGETPWVRRLIDRYQRRAVLKIRQSSSTPSMS
jgi:short subunit dehydrogenase-like uncharacterized protein